MGPTEKKQQLFLILITFFSSSFQTELDIFGRDYCCLNMTETERIKKYEYNRKEENRTEQQKNASFQPLLLRFVVCCFDAVDAVTPSSVHMQSM